MSITFADHDLNLVFGPGSSGATPMERAGTSNAKFVRGQIQIAPYSETATGRVLGALEALRAFGWDLLLQATLEGSAPLVSSPEEPATTLRTRREELGLTHERLAKRSGISVKMLHNAETIGVKTPIRILESLAQALALNEQKLGLVPNAGRDAQLGVRLREMATAGDITGFTATTVLDLSEAAWVIARQAALQDILAESGLQARVAKPHHDPNFYYPVYETGYRLAQKTRDLLGIGHQDPIESVRKIIEDDFGLPLVQLKMNQRFAGATIANGLVRGIVVNETGMNSNVWVRRMTLCHELGHLLWDPDDRLQRVMVDAYAELEMSDRETRRNPAEIRANAFAVAFLAPPAAVRSIADRHSGPYEVVREVMSTFGISATAAKHHVRNITNLDTFAGRYEALPNPEEHWVAMENLTLDYFPIKSTPLSRRGKYAWFVAKAFEAGEISLDSAASFLAVAPYDVNEEVLARVAELRTNSLGAV
jgi:Zn-dependent peptidase ImmA (M78 family)/transcriptional regulator with XRE-family HTH domain